MLFGPIGSTPIGSSTPGAMASISATAAGAVLVAAATIAGGSAAGTAAGTAPGATLRGTSSIVAGGATGTRSATAPGASLAALSAIQAGAATGGTGGQTTGNGTPGTITVPASRTAKFAGSKRVAVFDGSGPVTLTKGALDEFFYASDISKDLTDAATTAQSVAPVIPDLSGVTVLEGPVIQGNLIVARLGGIGSIIWRTTCANGEQIDHTLILAALDDRTHVFGKDPDDKRFFAFDFDEDTAASKWMSSLTSVQAPVVAGVTSLAAPTTQGNQAIVKIGGLDTAGENSCQLTALFANGEKVVRAIYFALEDH